MSKISELSDGGALQSTDYLIAVRSGGNVKVQPNGTVTGTTGSFSGNVTFADNAKAIFGAGSDLQIYHDGSNSIIKDNGTGGLILEGTTSTQIKGSSFVILRSLDGENMAVGNANGSFDLYYDNVKKLATTSTGIDVTGTVTADGLETLSTSGDIGYRLGYNAGASAYIHRDSATGHYLLQSDETGASWKIETDDGAGPLTRAEFTRNGDISFYEDTGTTPKFFWDASDETVSIGLGTSSTATISAFSRTVSAGLPSALRIIENTGASAYWDIGANNGANPNLNFYVNANTTPKVTFASSGNVGIGTSSPATALDVTTAGGGNFVAAFQNTTSATPYGVWIKEPSSAANGYPSLQVTDSTGSTVRFRVDSGTGNVGIGTSSPATPLHVVDPSTSYVLAETTGTGTSAGFRLKGDASADYTLFTTQGVNQFAIYDNAAGSERMRIDSSGNVGIGETSPLGKLHIKGSDTGATASAQGNSLVLEDSENGLSILSSTAGAGYINFGDSDDNNIGMIVYGHSSNSMNFWTNASERLRIDSSGNLLVGKTAAGFANTGHQLNGNGSYAAFTRDGATPVLVNRKTSDGAIVEYMKDGTAVGSIGVSGGNNIYISGTVTSHSGLTFATGEILPSAEGAITDGQESLGSSSNRFDDIYATNGTIQTSDRNEKENIRELLEAEARVAQAAKGLLRAFQWKDSVAEKGDDARIHFGIIAQDLQAAFEAEGLDAGRYAMFIHSTWTDEETGEERSRMGVRYSELLAFIIAAL